MEWIWLNTDERLTEKCLLTNKLRRHWREQAVHHATPQAVRLMALRHRHPLPRRRTSSRSKHWRPRSREPLRRRFDKTLSRVICGRCRRRKQNPDSGEPRWTVLPHHTSFWMFSCFHRSIIVRHAASTSASHPFFVSWMLACTRTRPKTASQQLSEPIACVRNSLL